MSTFVLRRTIGFVREFVVEARDATVAFGLLQIVGSRGSAVLFATTATTLSCDPSTVVGDRDIQLAEVAR